jgi:hypothetical protein
MLLKTKTTRRRLNPHQISQDNESRRAERARGSVRARDEAQGRAVNVAVLMPRGAFRATVAVAGKRGRRDGGGECEVEGG